MISLVVVPTKLAERTQDILADLNGARDAGMKADATMLRNAIRKQLKKKGSGKLYRSRKTKVARRLTAQAVALGERIRTGIDKNGKQLTRKDVGYDKLRLYGVTRQLARSLKQKGVGDVHATHQASVEGESPAPDVGTLAQAVKAGVVEGTMRVGVGGTWDGWGELEFGGGKVTGARPFMENGLADVRSKLGPVFASVLREKGPK